jgi:hypothetical protein
MIAALMVASLAAAACGSSATPTDIVVVITDAPPTTTPTDTAPATLEATFTPWATPTPAGPPTPTPLPTPTPKPVPTPTPGPTSPAQPCTGTATHLAFFVTAAQKEPFAVYCARLAKTYHLTAANWYLSPKKYMTVTYGATGGLTLGLREGNFCSGSCTPGTTVLGTANFGPKSGQLIATSTGYALYVNPGTATAYELTGHGMSQATFVSIAAQVFLVPKT